jgi:hypothetical protein
VNEKSQIKQKRLYSEEKERKSIRNHEEIAGQQKSM